MNQQLGLKGGGTNKYDPCPPYAAPNWGTFITTGPSLDGSVEHYCCKNNYRTEECMKVTDDSNLEDLRLAQITNFA